MSKIEDLKNTLKVLLEATEDTNQIQQIASINNIVNDIEIEQNDMLTKHNELKTAYKEAIMRGGMVKQEPVEDVASTKAVDFDSMLQEFIKNN